MGLMKTVGGLGLRKLQRTADLIAMHGTFKRTCQHMYAEGKERRRSMRRDIG